MGFGLKLRELGLGKHKKCVLGLGGKLRDEHSANRIVVRKRIVRTLRLGLVSVCFCTVCNGFVCKFVRSKGGVVERTYTPTTRDVQIYSLYQRTRLASDRDRLLRPECFVHFGGMSAESCTSRIETRSVRWTERPELPALRLSCPVRALPADSYFSKQEHFWRMA